MKFVLKEKCHVNSCIEYLSTVELGVYEVIVQPHKSSRSNSQNALLWTWVKVIGDDLGYAKNEMKRELCKELLGYEKFMVGVEVCIEINGTSSLNVKDFTEFLQNIEYFAADHGIRLPHPEDYNIAMGVK